MSSHYTYLHTSAHWFVCVALPGSISVHACANFAGQMCFLQRHIHAYLYLRTHAHLGIDSCREWLCQVCGPNVYHPTAYTYIYTCFHTIRAYTYLRIGLCVSCCQAVSLSQSMTVPTSQGRRVLQCVAVWCSVLLCFAVCCSVTGQTCFFERHTRTSIYLRTHPYLCLDSRVSRRSAKFAGPTCFIQRHIREYTCLHIIHTFTHLCIDLWVSRCQAASQSQSMTAPSLRDKRVSCNASAIFPASVSGVWTVQPLVEIVFCCSVLQCIALCCRASHRCGVFERWNP